MKIKITKEIKNHAGESPVLGKVYEANPITSPRSNRPAYHVWVDAKTPCLVYPYECEVVNDEDWNNG